MFGMHFLQAQWGPRVYEICIFSSTKLWSIILFCIKKYNKKGWKKGMENHHSRSGWWRKVENTDKTGTLLLALRLDMKSEPGPLRKVSCLSLGNFWLFFSKIPWSACCFDACRCLTFYSPTPSGSANNCINYGRHFFLCHVESAEVQCAPWPVGIGSRRSKNKQGAEEPKI